jgi:hypothetical protein
MEESRSFLFILEKKLALDYFCSPWNEFIVLNPHELSVFQRVADQLNWNAYQGEAALGIVTEMPTLGTLTSMLSRQHFMFFQTKKHVDQATLRHQLPPFPNPQIN